MRDKIKNIEYYDEFIAQDSNRIRKFQSKLDSNEVKEDRIIPVKIKIHDLKLGILIAKYSKGANVNELKSEYIPLIKESQTVWQEDYYVKNLWMISIGVLLNLDDLVKKIYFPLISKSNIDDWLFNFLLMGEYKDKTLRFSDVYNDLYMLTAASGSEAKAILKNYILKWYELHKECGWYGSHFSSQKLYFGYWSFEAGAVAKILGIDDNELKDVDYYPYDMVHFKG